MRYDLTGFEWSAVEPLLPSKRRGVQPKRNRRVLNGIFWVLRAGAPWRDLPERYGSDMTCYNRFDRSRACFRPRLLVCADHQAVPRQAGNRHGRRYSPGVVVGVSVVG